MRYRHVYTPTDHITITPDMVKRWMAMEERLNEQLELVEDYPYHIYGTIDIIRLLDYIKLGEDDNE